MRLLNNTESSVSLEITNEEFNFLREVLREIPGRFAEEELPTLTGFTKEQVRSLKENLRTISEDINLDL